MKITVQHFFIYDRPLGWPLSRHYQSKKRRICAGIETLTIFNMVFNQTFVLYNIMSKFVQMGIFSKINNVNTWLASRADVHFA